MSVARFARAVSSPVCFNVCKEAHKAHQAEAEASNRLVDGESLDVVWKERKIKKKERIYMLNDMPYIRNWQLYT